MNYKIYIIAAAEKDMIELYKYMEKYESREKADNLLDQIELTCLSLTEFPERGHRPPELERIGVSDYKEIHYKTYRILYQILGDKVFIHCVLDGRRDLQEVLERRLLR